MRATIHRTPSRSFGPFRGGAGPGLFSHAALALAFLGAGGALLVWPQWLARDGARAALRLQEERERGAAERLETLRALNDRLRRWETEGRRVFLAEELERYPLLVRAVAERQGARALRVAIHAGAASGAAARWRALALAAPADDETMPFAGGDRPGPAPRGGILPRRVTLVVAGPWESVFRTIVALSRQRQIFIPDRWEIAPYRAPGDPKPQVRALVQATLFVVEEPAPPPPAGQPIAAGEPLEDERG